MPAHFRFVGRRRIKPVLQLSATDCGPACLTMILNYYGLELLQSEVSEHFGSGRDGVSAPELAQAAEYFGLKVRALSLERGRLAGITLPAIAYWRSEHFVIVERHSNDWVQIIDPGCGRRRLSITEFNESFSNIILTFSPGESFSPRRSVRRLSYRQYFAPVLVSRQLIVGILAASLLLQVVGLSMPLFTAAVVDKVLPSANEALLNWLGLGMLAILFGQGLAFWLRSRMLVNLQLKADGVLMTGFFRHLQSLPFSFFQNRSTGDLIERFASNVAIREMLSQSFISLILDCTLAGGYMVVLLFKAPRFAAAVLLLSLVQALILSATRGRTRLLEDAVLQSRSKSTGYLFEAIAGIATLKSAGAEARAVRHWTALFQKQLSASTERDRFEATVGAVLILLRALAPLILLWIGAQQVLHGAMTLGTMLAANGLALGVLLPVGAILPNWQKFHATRAHLDRILDVLTTAPEQGRGTLLSPPRLSGRIELKNVSFRYAPNGPWSLRNINIRIEAGQKVAIVGKTGSGKSTLAKVLLGLYVPTQGEVTFDALPLQCLNFSELRQQFGVVLQDSYVFGGSIRENIAFNEPEMPLQQVKAAISAAALEKEIAGMPMGLATYVGEGGNALSGGQRQRLAIARAIAHRPAVVLLDEATSHLDSMTEQAIHESFSNLRCTRLIIAHRLSTVRDADLILVMENGTIAERGTHAELVIRGGPYSRLAGAQQSHTRLGSESLEVVA